MAYLILADHNGEFDRRELRGSTVIGRATDCDVRVRDILLSRKHCRIEPFDKRWIVTDLASKNGTKIGGETITRHILSDGESIRIGKTQLCFHSGAFVPKITVAAHRDIRPSDPVEALAGTVCGFQFFDMEEDSRLSGFPIPRPRPADGRDGEAHDLVSEIASTVWDVILSEPEMPARPAKKPKPVAVRHESPHDAAPIPDWLAKTYVALACIVGFASFSVILLRSVF